MSALLVCAALAGFAFFYALWVPREEILAPEPPGPLDHLREKKKVIYDNLKDLNFEYRTGKLSDDDYQQLKTSLQYEMAVVMKGIEDLETRVTPASRRPGEAGVAAVPAALPCPACGRINPPAHKHCSECGGRLVAAVLLALLLCAVPAVAQKAAAPSGPPLRVSERAVILQPRSGKLLVTELYVVRRDAADTARRPFRFFVPEGGHLSLQASATGPDSVALPLGPKAEPGAAGVFTAGHQFAAGETRVEVSYHLDYPGSFNFATQAVEPIERTRVAVAHGVTAAGEGVRFAATEPQMKFGIYDVGDSQRWGITLTGESRPPTRASGGEAGDSEAANDSGIAQAPGPVQAKTAWALAGILALLGAGFVRLWRQSAPAVSRPARHRA